MTGGSEGSSRGYGMGRTGEGTYSTPFVGDTTPGRRTGESCARLFETPFRDQRVGGPPEEVPRL